MFMNTCTLIIVQIVEERVIVKHFIVTIILYAHASGRKGSRSLLIDAPGQCRKERFIDQQTGSVTVQGKLCDCGSEFFGVISGVDGFGVVIEISLVHI